MLAWFSEDERHVCGSCKEKACVTLPGVLAAFCLACGAIWIINCHCQRITEYRARFVERYLVLGEIRGRLLGTPLETHASV